jgi:ABC-type Mn2+/Zn2+ transport system ATPase subunit
MNLGIYKELDLSAITKHSFVAMIHNSYKIFRPVMHKYPKAVAFYFLTNISVCLLHNFLSLKLDEIITKQKDNNAESEDVRYVGYYFLSTCIATFAVTYLQKFFIPYLYQALINHYYPDLIITANTEDAKGYGAASIVARSNANFISYYNEISKKTFHLLARSLIILYQFYNQDNYHYLSGLVCIFVAVTSHYIGKKTNVFHIQHEKLIVNITNMMILGKTHFEEIMHLGYQHHFENNINNLIERNKACIKDSYFIKSVKDLILTNINPQYFIYLAMILASYLKKYSSYEFLDHDIGKSDIKVLMLVVSVAQFFLSSQIDMDYLTSLAKKMDNFNTDVSNKISANNQRRKLHGNLFTSIEGSVKFANKQITFEKFNINFSISDSQKIFIIEGNNGTGKSTLYKLIIGEVQYKGVDVSTHNAKLSITRMISSSDNLPFELIQNSEKTLLNAILFPCHNVAALISVNNNIQQKHIINHLSPYLQSQFAQKIKETGLTTDNTPKDKWLEILQNVRKEQIFAIIKEYDSSLVGKLNEANIKLSQGEKRVMQIISAITAYPSPKILILDEILNNIDEAKRGVILSIILKYLPNTSLLFTEHSIDIPEMLKSIKTERKLDIKYYSATETHQKNETEITHSITFKLSDQKHQSQASEQSVLDEETQKMNQEIERLRQEKEEDRLVREKLIHEKEVQRQEKEEDRLAREKLIHEKEVQRQEIEKYQQEIDVLRKKYEKLHQEREDQRREEKQNTPTSALPVSFGNANTTPVTPLTADGNHNPKLRSNAFGRQVSGGVTGSSGDLTYVASGHHNSPTPTTPLIRAGNHNHPAPAGSNHPVSTPSSTAFTRQVSGVRVASSGDVTHVVSPKIITKQGGFSGRRGSLTEMDERRVQQDRHNCARKTPDTPSRQKTPTGPHR